MTVHKPLNNGNGSGGPGSSSDVVAQMAEELARRTTRRAAPGSIFHPVVGGLDALGRIDDVMRTMLSDDPPVELYEFRSSLDERMRLDASSQATFTDWMFENIGQPETMPGFFKRNGALVRVPRIGETGWQLPARGDDGPAQVRPISAAALIDIIQHRFWVYREKVEVRPDAKSSNGKRRIISRTQIIAPREVGQLTIDGVAEWHTVPEIVSITHTQTLRADGTLLAEPGYDRESKLLYLPDTDQIPPKWPPHAEIHPDWVSWSRDVINYLLQDFPFEEKRHKLNMIALMLTPLMRQVVPGPYPMFVINAHQRGTGKSLLARVVRTLHGGVHRPELPGDDEEIRKQITAVLTTTTAPVVNFDNVTQRISSGHLANLLTTRIWTDRPLGRTGNVEAVNDRIWICTGNNVIIGGDLARRVMRISLDAVIEHPEYRTGFAVRDLVRYVQDNRGMLLQALLVQLRWWVQRGKPRQLIRTDDYDEWSGSMAEILEGGGLDDDRIFAKGELVPEGVTKSFDELELANCLAMISEVWGVGRPFQVGDLRRLTLDASVAERLMDALPSRCTAARDIWKSLGNYLTKNERTPGNGLRAVAVREMRGGWQYVLEMVETGLPGALTKREQL